MPLRVKTLDTASAQAWDRFVREQCEAATFFHLAGWKNIIQETYGRDCHYFYAERDGQIVGVLPIVRLRSRMFGDRLISNAFTIGGGAAAVEDEAYGALDAEAVRLMERLGVDCLEVRRPARLHESHEWKSKSDVYSNFSRVIAADEAECLKQIPRKQRAVVRKALTDGLCTDEIDGTPGRFFPLYALSMRNMGTPVFGRAFFERLMSEFRGMCDCLTVLRGETPVSSVLNFYFRDAVMPYYTGCLPEARELGANDFMYWRLMRRARDRGCTIFDFGRSKHGTGPHSFKKNWGFEPTPIVHEYLVRGGGEPPEVNPLNPKYRLFIALWRRLPLSVANWLGPLVVRQIG